MEEFVYAVEQEGVGKRLDVFLTGEMDGFSRNSLQLVISKGCVFVNGKEARPSYKMALGDVIHIFISEPEMPLILPENIPLNILFEDESVIVINKPQGMVVHPAAGHYTGTLVNALMYHCGDGLSGINGKIRPGIVHRIDKDTSGVLVVAKTNEAHQFLSAQLERHTMMRIYNALVFNNIKQDCGTVEGSIGRSSTDRKKMAVNEKNGRRAITHYKVLERFGKYTWIEARLETGRTHQIRVHMAYIGHPLLGDTVYGSVKGFPGLCGQALHAKSLGFIHPRSHTYMEFEAGLPEYFTHTIERIGGK